MVSNWSSLKVLSAQCAVGVTGLTLSIVLHELFHMFVHRGSITAVHAFPDSTTIAEVVSVSPSQGYDVVPEEFMAYTITMLVMLVTIVLIVRIHDAADQRLLSQSLRLDDTQQGYASAYEDVIRRSMRI